MKDTGTAVTHNYSKYSDIICICIISLCELFFFRDLLTPGAMLGDTGDGRLYSLILEHWLHWFTGHEQLTTLSQFYPVTGTLGYTDIFLGQALFYVPQRFMGLDMFLAYKIVTVLQHIFGSFCLFYFLRRFLKLNSQASLAGVLTFSFASGYASMLNHVQMLVLSALPLLLCTLGYLCENINVRPKRVVLSVISLTLLALTGYSAWYIFYFACLFICASAASGLLVLFYKKLCNWGSLYRLAKKHWLELSAYCVYFVCLLIPLVMLYLPVALSQGMREWKEVCMGLPQFCDILNVGTGNIILGKIIYSLTDSAGRIKYERELWQGCSVAFLVVFGYLLFRYLSREHTEYFPHQETEFHRICIISFTVATLFLFLSILSVGSVSPWWIAWKFIPGASSIRAVSRLWFFLSLPLSIIIAYLLGHFNFKHSWYISAIAILIWFSNISFLYSSRWNAIEQQKMLENILPPPPMAKVIALYNSQVAPKNISRNIEMQLDAWLLADHYGIQTINGYSGQFPAAYLNLIMKNADSASFPVALLEYKYIHDIKDDIYIYDLSNRSWALDSNYQYPPLPALETTYQFSNKNWAVRLGDFYPTESFGCWMGKRGTLCFKLPVPIHKPLNVTLNTCAFYSDKQVEVSVNGQALTTLTIKPKNSQYSFAIPKSLIKADGKVDLTFATQGELLSPAEVLSEHKFDRRKLSIMLRDITIKQ